METSTRTAHAVVRDDETSARVVHRVERFVAAETHTDQEAGLLVAVVSETVHTTARRVVTRAATAQLVARAADA